MKKSAICFTSYGKAVIEKLNKAYVQHGIEPAEAYIMTDAPGTEEDGFIRVTEPLSVWAAKRFAEHSAFLFVGAAGIAVRAIAGCVKDKLTDSPVIVIDDAGRFVIPLLAGHAGGAGKLAVTAAELLSATPVLTTSTDVHEAFSADVFARENGLSIRNREGIKKVSARAVEGKPVTISVKDYPPEEPVDIIIADETEREYSLLLPPKKYILGAGMKKDIAPETAETFLLDFLKNSGVRIGDVYALCTIDLKENEPAVRAFCTKYSLPLITFEAGMLAKAQGEFSASDFVRRTVGVDNVCERAAVLGAGPGGALAVKKQAGNGVTAALAVRGICRKQPGATAASQAAALSQETASSQAAAQPRGADKTAASAGLTVVGLGPGKACARTGEVQKALERADVIAGYTAYVDPLRTEFPDKEFLVSGMTREIERCRRALEAAAAGRNTVLVCSGDAGVYGMASPVLELSEEFPDVSIRILPGITAALSGASLLGAPLSHDFAVISLSDRLTPRETIMQRVRHAAEAGMPMAVYNPGSRTRKGLLAEACGILREILPDDTPCGLARNIGREGESAEILPLAALAGREADMFTTVFIGCPSTRIIGGRMVTPRGYEIGEKPGKTAE